MRLALRHIFAAWVLAALALVVLPSAAAAQGAGIRGGVSSDPDQFYFGGHYETRPLVEQLYFKPNAELGVGEDLLTVGLNAEFVYKVPLQGPWNFYAGAGPAINIFNFDNGADFTEPGFNVLFGVETTRGLMFELKLGAMDSPDLKFGVGYTWR